MLVHFHVVFLNNVPLCKFYNPWRSLNFGNVRRRKEAACAGASTHPPREGPAYNKVPCVSYEVRTEVL
jgi:hypothetical protein